LFCRVIKHNRLLYKTGSWNFHNHEKWSFLSFEWKNTILWTLFATCFLSFFPFFFKFERERGWGWLWLGAYLNKLAFVDRRPEKKNERRQSTWEKRKFPWWRWWEILCLFVICLCIWKCRDTFTSNAYHGFEKILKSVNINHSS
jgi:hypothetical protein